MIKINTLITLENISDCYYVNNDLEIYNIKTKHIKKQTLGLRGYYYVTLNDKNNKQIKVPIHKIIALAFINNKPYEVINHIDGNKLNNSINNLEFVTQKDNIKHSWDIGTTIRKEQLFEIEINSKKYIGTIKELSMQTKIPKGTLYDLYYKRKSSNYHNINYIIKVNRLSKN